MGLSEKPTLDNFRVQLPRDFFFDEVVGAYMPLINAHDTLFDNIYDYIEESVQGFVFPDAAYTPTQYNKKTRNRGANQQNPESAEVYQRSGVSKLQLVERSFGITFRLNAGFLNHSIFLDQYFRSFDHDEEKRFCGDIIYQIFNKNGGLVTQMKFGSCLFTGITGYETDYSSNVANTTSFTCEFYYNDFEVSVTNYLGA